MFVHYCNIMVCVVYFSGQVAGLGSIQFRNWNCSWWNWKWNWNWRLWNWNWKPEFNVLQLLPQYLLVNQQFPNFSFNRGHNLPCDWLLMQQGLNSLNIAPPPPVVWSQKTHGEGTLFALSRQQSEGLKMVTINISLPPWHITKLLSLLNKKIMNDFRAWCEIPK